MTAYPFKLACTTLCAVLIAGCGGGGGSGSSAVANVPMVDVTASSTTLAAGDPVTLTWTSQYASSCHASGPGWNANLSISGSETRTVSESGTFTLTCTGAGGSVSRSVSVSVLPLPTMAASASSDVIDIGTSFDLVWSSQNASNCTASGNGWSGATGQSGQRTITPLESADYTVTCTGSGGTVSRTVTVLVDDGIDVSVQLNASALLIRENESVTLTWNSTNAKQCTASGDWQGNRAFSGNQATGPLLDHATYTLVCDRGPGNDSAIAMVTVQVRKVVTVSWEKPTTNENGSPLVDIAAFKLYVGASSGVYDEPLWLVGDDDLDRTFDLLPGTYYMAVTTFDSDGEESAFSEELVVEI